jgi:hypothetical protein
MRNQQLEREEKRERDRKKDGDTRNSYVEGGGNTRHTHTHTRGFISVKASNKRN